MPALVTESQLLAARIGLGLPVVVQDVMTINNITLHEISHTDYLAIVEHALLSMPNGYVYVHNNPVSWVDPMGLDFLSISVDFPVVPFLYGVALGVVYAGDGVFHISMGTGWVPLPGLAITGSLQDVVPGIFKVLQVGYWGGAQGGLDQNNEPCWEVGMVTPGGSATVGIITPPFTLDDIKNEWHDIRKRQGRE